MAEAKAQVRCPFCTRMADPDKVPGEGDIICVQCGLNLLTGQHIHQPRHMQQQKPSAKPRRVWLWAAAPALLVAAAGAVAVAYLLTKDPVKDAAVMAAAGNTLEATHTLDTYIEKRPDDARAHLLRGKLFWKAQDYNRAAQDFEAVLEREPRNADAAALAMLATSRLNDRGQQTALYQKVLQAQPDNAAAQRLLALTQGAAGKYEEQVAAIERMAAQGSPDVFLLQMRGAALALLGRRSEAELSFTEAGKAGGAGDLPKLAQGLLASMNGDDERAMQMLSSAQGGGPEVSGLANTRLGLLHITRGEYEQAVPLLRKAMEQGARNEAALFHALCLRQLRLTQEARDALTAIREGKGKYASDAALELALMQLEAGEVDLAEDNLRQAQAGGETTAKLQTIEGKIYLARGQDLEAQAKFRQAVETDSSYAPAHLENGLLYVKRGITDDGIAELQKYLDLAGDTVAGGVPEVRLLLSQLQQTAAGSAAPEAAK